MNRNTFNAMAAQYAVKTVSGKNLADLVSLFGDGYTNTVNGVTVMVKDGYAVFSGQHTNTGWTNVLFTTSPDRSVVFPAGTYSIPNLLVCAFRTMSGNSSVGNKTGTFTLDEECYLTQCYVAFLGAQTVNAKVPLIIVQGTQIPVEYEPYCPDGIRQWNNGVRCVLPEVQIGGKVEQERCSGKNLCDLDVDVFNETTYWRKSDVMDESFLRIPYRENTRYTVSWDATLPEGSEAVYYIRFQYAGGGSSGFGGFEVVDARYDLDGVRSITSLPGETVERIFATAGIGGSFTLHWIQVEEGVQATEWEPCTGGVPTPNPNYPIEPVISEGTEVVCRSENVLDLVGILGEGYTNTLNGITVTVENGVAKFRGEHTNEGWSSPLSVTSLTRHQYMLYPGTYTIPVVNGVALVLQFAEKDSWVAGTHGGNKSLTFTTPEPLWMVGFYVAFYGIQTVNADIPLTIVRGTEPPTEYIPYHAGGTAVAPELLAIPGTEHMDTWNPQTGKGVRRVGVQRFDGTEAWYTYNTTSVALGNWCGKKDIQRSYDKPSGYLCNIAQAGINGNPDANDGTFVTHSVSSANWIVFHTNMPLAEWKSYLAAQTVAGTPVTVWYALAEPVEFQTDPQPLIAPHGSGQIIQTGGTLDGIPITVKYVTHS